MLPPVAHPVKKDDTVPKIVSHVNMHPGRCWLGAFDTLERLTLVRYMHTVIHCAIYMFR